MIRPFRFVATLAAAAALVLGTSARISKAEAGPASTVAYRGSASFQPKEEPQGPYQLDKLMIASKAILNVTDYYVDPARIGNARRVLVSDLSGRGNVLYKLKQHGLADYQSAKLVVLVFTCNHCPVAVAYQDRLIAVQKDYKDKGVALDKIVDAAVAQHADLLKQQVTAGRLTQAQADTLLANQKINITAHLNNKFVAGLPGFDGGFGFGMGGHMGHGRGGFGR